METTLTFLSPLTPLDYCLNFIYPSFCLLLLVFLLVIMSVFSRAASEKKFKKKNKISTRKH